MEADGNPNEEEDHTQLHKQLPTHSKHVEGYTDAQRPDLITIIITVILNANYTIYIYTHSIWVKMKSLNFS